VASAKRARQAVSGGATSAAKRHKTTKTCKVCGEVGHIASNRRLCKGAKAAVPGGVSVPGTPQTPMAAAASGRARSRGSVNYALLDGSFTTPMQMQMPPPRRMLVTDDAFEDAGAAASETLISGEAAGLVSTGGDGKLRLSSKTIQKVTKESQKKEKEKLQEIYGENYGEYVKQQRQRAKSGWYASAPVTFICVLCILRTQISRSIRIFTLYSATQGCGPRGGASDVASHPGEISSCKRFTRTYTYMHTRTYTLLTCHSYLALISRSFRSHFRRKRSTRLTASGRASGLSSRTCVADAASACN
jgi:hypothetical protein